jgi:hypothetical protein
LQGLHEYHAIVTNRRPLQPPHSYPEQVAGQILFGAPPNDEDYDEGNATASGTLLSVSGWVLVAVLGLWLMAYVSGAFPYLGTYEYSRQGMVVTNTALGSRNMLLFKGQEAFIDYEIDSTANDRGEVYLDIQPWPAAKWTPAMRRISGKNKGTLTITVPETGVYRFHHHANGPFPYGENLTYSVTWGAR